ncbi:MAG: aminoacyl-tRNA hydrolase [Clostridia bacterium]|nr:aminoacyl-tRNA hydrolase [Clostridia bacterium]
MYLIVGLGNPERKYLNTFHNVGFMCVDLLADKLGDTFTKSECKAMTMHTRINGQKVIVAKPLTYMNLSGESVVELVNKYKIDTANLIVVYDDVDLPMGSVRIRKGGSAGTHNGMRNIISLLGDTSFARIRIGIGKQTPMQLVDFVLSNVGDDDKKLLNPALKGGAEALYDFASGQDIDRVMVAHNVKLPSSK